MSSGQKQREKPAKKPKPTADKTPSTGWPAWARGVVSILVVWHLFVVFIMALSNAQSSAVVVSIAQSTPVKAYADPLYLNHGYGFFAPDPPSGRLIEYTLFDKAGNTIETRRFPSRREHWPRLLYHRYMMLADQMDAVRGEYADRRKIFLLHRFAWQLLRENPEAERVTVRRKIHSLTPRLEYLEGQSLSAPEKFAVDVARVPIDPAAPLTPDTPTRQQTVEVTQTRSDLEIAERQAMLPRPAQATPNSQPEVITPGRQP